MAAATSRSAASDASPREPRRGSRPGTRHRSHAVAIAAAALGLTLAAGPATAQPPQASEHDVKAAFLFHFTRFVEWPAAAYPAPDAPFALCVLGHDPFGSTLDEVVRGERVGGREMVVRRPATAAQAAGCQLVFVAEEADPSLIEGVPGLREGLVLGVGEAPGLLARGALIRFVVRDGRVRLQVNSRTLERTRLTVSSKLLRLAEQVTPAPP